MKQKIELKEIYAMCAKKFQKVFIDNEVYVHSLGIGSLQRMALMIRNEITTFDSSNVLRGAISWDTYNPLNPQARLDNINKIDFPFTKNFCICPTCRRYNLTQLVDENDKMYGRVIIKHNLWYQLSINMFLDSIRKDKFSKIYMENFNTSKDMERCLEFCDYADKHGFDVAYEKYKIFLKKDVSKQNTLF
ncbi:MAG: hypothetical protein ACOCRX_10535 [Candidatus Woesearchaeota archaeon]